MPAEILTVSMEKLVAVIESVLGQRMNLASFLRRGDSVPQIVWTTVYQDRMALTKNIDRVNSDDRGSFFFCQSVKVHDLVIADVHAPMPYDEADHPVEPTLDDRAGYPVFHFVL